MKKSFVFDVLFILLMVGVVACEEEIENVSLSNASVEDWYQASASFFADLADPKKDSPRGFVHEFNTTDHLDKVSETKAFHQLVVFESGELENAGFILSEEKNQEHLLHQILGLELEKAAAEEEELKLTKRDLNDSTFQIGFLKAKIKMVVKNPDLIRVVLKENPKPKELKVNSFS